MAGSTFTADDRVRLDQAMAWTDAVAPLSSCATPALSESVLNLTNAADRVEVETEIQAIASKLNEVIAAINAMKPA